MIKSVLKAVSISEPIVVAPAGISLPVFPLLLLSFCCPVGLLARSAIAFWRLRHWASRWPGLLQNVQRMSGSRGRLNGLSVLAAVVVAVGGEVAARPRLRARTGSMRSRGFI